MRVSVGLRVVMVTERAREQTVDVTKPHKIVAVSKTGCKICLRGEMEEQRSQYKYLGTILYKQVSMERELRE